MAPERWETIRRHVFPVLEAEGRAWTGNTAGSDSVKRGFRVPPKHPPLV